MAAKKKEKPPLRATTIPLNNGLRTRVRMEVGINTVDIGASGVSIQRPRYPTEEEREIWPDAEIVLDHITVNFKPDESGEPYSIKAGVCHFSKGAT